MFKAFLSASLLVLVGCVTPGDFQEFSDIQQVAITGIVEAQEQHQAKVEALLADTTKTREEVVEGLQELALERNAVIEQIAKEAGTSVQELLDLIRRRTEAVVTAPAAPLTGHPIIDFLLQIAIAAGGGVVATNTIRDKRRLLRGEPVGPSIPLPPQP